MAIFLIFAALSNSAIKKTFHLHFKYKHYKFLKSEGLVGAVCVQRLPQKLHDRSPFKPKVHSFI